MDNIQFKPSDGGNGYNFEDVSKRECWVAHSSLASEEAMWFGVKENPMQITRGMAEDLSRVLWRFAKTGELTTDFTFEIEHPYMPVQNMMQLNILAVKALDAYLNASSKEQRRAASVLAKDVWEKYHGKPYHNTNEDVTRPDEDDEGKLGLYDAVARIRKDNEEKPISPRIEAALVEPGIIITGGEQPFTPPFVKAKIADNSVMRLTNPQPGGESPKYKVIVMCLNCGHQGHHWIKMGTPISILRDHTCVSCNNRFDEDFRVLPKAN